MKLKQCALYVENSSERFEIYCQTISDADAYTLSKVKEPMLKDNAYMRKVPMISKDIEVYEVNS